jgi:uncharacterized protein YbjT (DUF2867 family)
MAVATQTYSVLGATGNIGKRITEYLLSKGHKVRAVGRDRSKLEFLARKGAEACVGNLEDAAFMAKVFEGAVGAFCMIPPNYTSNDMLASQSRIGDSIAKSLKESRLPFVINLSSVGADLSAKTGPIMTLHHQEERLNQLPDAAIVHLRVGYFMENLFGQIGVIKKTGMMGGSLQGNVGLPLIATQDIAAVAAHLLLTLDYADKSTRELLGPKDVTLDDVARVLGAAIGKPELKYSFLPYEIVEKGMVESGLSPSVAMLLNEMNRAYNEGVIRPRETRGPLNTTPTSIADFAKTFALAYRG